MAQKETRAFSKLFQWKLPSMLYAKRTSWRKNWFKMEKNWPNDKKNTQQMLKEKQKQKKLENKKDKKIK
jgi:hypothetical protein